MERRIQLLATVLFAVFALTFTSCSDDDEDNGPAFEISNLTSGTWTLSSTEVSDPILQALIDEFDDEVETIVFNTDGTYVNVFGEEEETGTYSVDGQMMTLDAGTEDEGVAEIRELTSSRLVIFTEEDLEGETISFTITYTK